MSAKRVLLSCAVLTLASVEVVGCDPAATGGSVTTSGSADSASAPDQASPDAQSSASAPSNGSAGQTPASKDSDAAATAPAGRAASCGAGNVTFTVSPVSRPINYLLITAKNTSGSPCDLGIIAGITFDGKIRAKLPDGLGGGPNILEPGRSDYQSVALDQQDAPGTGTETSYMTLELEGGNTVKIKNRAYVHAPSTSVWQQTAEDALSS